MRHTALAKITRVEALSQLSLFSEAVQLLMELLSGARLPQSSNEHDRQTDSHMVVGGDPCLMHTITGIMYLPHSLL